MNDEGKGCLIIIVPAIILAVILTILFPPKPAKPVKLPSSEQVGEAAGQVSKGFAKGYWKGIWSRKEKEATDGIP